MPFDTGAYLQASQAGAAALAGGITSAAGSITKSIEKHQAEAKRLKAYRNMAVDGLGLPPDEVDQLDADQIEGKLQAVAVHQHMQQMEQSKAEAKARQDEHNYQMTQRAAGVRFQSRLGAGVPAAIPGTDIMDDADPSAVAANVSGQGNRAPAGMQDYAHLAGEEGFNLDPRELIALMKENDSSEQPQAWTSPAGNPYVRYHHTLMPDRAPFDISQYADIAPDGVTPLPNGRGGVVWKPNTKTKPLPQTFYTGQKDLIDQLQRHQNNAALSDDELKATTYIPGDTVAAKRANINKKLATAQEKLASHYETFRKQGYANDDVFNTLYATHGLTPPGEGAATAGDSSRAAGGNERITVTKDGKQFSLPASQWSDAEKQGYKRVP